MTADEAKSSVEILDSAIEQVTDYQVHYGVKSNELESSFNRLQIQLENVAASKSQTYDTDYAKQSANLARTQLLQNSGTSMLLHINQSKESVLQLLN